MTPSIRVYEKVGGPPCSTPQEPWTVERHELGHFYDKAADFALEVLGEGNGRSCLVIGSPIFEAEELAEHGWKVTYLDIREPVIPEVIEYVKGNACDIPFADESFDAISSTCVLCHVGLGRYGEEAWKNGEMLMMSEMSRVLKPDGRIALMAGPTADGDSVLVIGSVHRVLPPRVMEWMANEVGFTVARTRIYSGTDSDWHENEGAIGADVTNPDYICVELTKGASTCLQVT